MAAAAADSEEETERRRSTDAGGDGAVQFPGQFGDGARTRRKNPEIRTGETENRTGETENRTGHRENGARKTLAHNPGWATATRIRASVRDTRWRL